MHRWDMISRRNLVLGLGALGVACSKRQAPTSSSGPGAPPQAHTLALGEPPRPPSDLMEGELPRSARGTVEVLEWEFDGVMGGTKRAAIVVPAWGDPSARYPVLIALHGRGEAVKPPAQGAMGWPNDYKLLRAIERLCAPPLNDADYEGLSDPARMARLNADLRDRPFGGLIVACPHIPDVMSGDGPTNEEVAQFLISVLLPRVYKETPARAQAESTGIDGVSMGGMLAIRIGLTHPGVFGAVGTLQAGLREDEADELTALARAARAKRPSLQLRLITSHDDYFRPAIHRVSDAWHAAGIQHDFADIPGPHDYIFNRGPGAIEMLSWHDRVLSHA